ncbi:MAG: type VI secretion system ATPase TssH [Deltaproteobacteria bacterium]|jgi:type VI secretion system protein VasG|nr:type VI secretion system ATPase TssH [Deltaproteobacteria bacterium]
MFGTDIKALVGKLNGKATQALYDAGGLAVSRSNYEVATEHFLLKCLEDKETDFSLAVDYFKRDRAEIIRFFNQALENFSRGNTGRPTFSPILLDLLEASFLVSAVDLKNPSIRTGGVLLAYLRRPSVYSQGAAPPALAAIPRDELFSDFLSITALSAEIPVAESATGEEREAAAARGEGESFTAKYCEDFTLKAAKGGMDPVFGRDAEIRSMVSVLSRRRKNNPILVGEPGVGKTAVMEGLAQRIVEGDVPLNLQGVTLLGLDMGLLEAGASMKGEFERRLKGIISEIKSSPKPIILFIDEAHTLVGAGGTPGGSDAANLLKPALARGELKTCAATTFKEYQKYFEKDAALARRFQPIILEEPDAKTTALILRGLRESYEKSHQVIMSEGAIEAAAEYAARFISGRFLPDKAVDLMDTACARVKVGLFAKPAELEDLERAIQAGERELAGLERDRDDGSEVNLPRMEELSAALRDNREKSAALKDSWEKEREAARRLIAARTAYLEAARAEAATAAPTEDSPSVGVSPSAEASPPAETATPTPSATPASALKAPPVSPAASPEGASPPETAAAPVSVAELKERFQTLKDEFYGLSEKEPLIEVEVTRDVVAQVVADWTGIPVGKIAMAQASLIQNLKERLQERILGQDDAIAAIAQVIQASKAGLKDPLQPLGVFLLVGPSGVGKTETCLALADALFGDSSNVITINMSEFQEKFTVTRLIGSPPGYVGYGEGGLLTEAIRRKPYSVVVLDEVEKAHLDVLNLFYQVFDKGELTDGEGKKASFRNSIILLTSNLASETISRAYSGDDGPTYQELVSLIRPTLNESFKPALLARMTVTPFRALSAEALTQVTDLKLGTLKKRLAANAGLTLKVDEGVTKAIVERCRDAETGARNIDFILDAGILPLLSKEILSQMSQGEIAQATVSLSLSPSGDFAVSFAKD